MTSIDGNSNVPAIGFWVAVVRWAPQAPLLAFKVPGRMGMQYAI
jgi:hypothetical protein